MKQTLKNLQQLMHSQSIEYAWITTPDNINYFSGFLSDPHERLTALYVTQDNALLVVPNMEVEDAQKASNLTAYGYSDTEEAFLVAKQNTNFPDNAKLYIEEEHVTVKREKALFKNFKAAQLNAIDQIIKDMRNIKTADEIEILKSAAQFADKALQIGVSHLKEGITEKEVAQHLESEILKIEGISGMSFNTTVLFGDHAASPHGTPGKRELKNDEYVLFDLGVIYNGYCSDITRTIAFGNPPTFHQEIHAIITEANQRAIEGVRPGVKISEIDALARDYITEKGYGDAFPHRLGHGLGITVHEFPDISSANDDTLKPGMCFTIEPGIYLHGEIGVRVEDDILVTEDGYEVLTRYEK